MSIGLIVSPKTSLRRYWAPETECFAPASALLYFLDNGWEVLNVEVDPVFYSSGRYSTLYHFLLARGEECLDMPVMSNPAVCRLIERKEWVIAERTSIANATQDVLLIPLR